MPQHGTATWGSIIYTPETGFTGTDEITYRMCDTKSYCATVTVTTTIARSPAAASDAVVLPATGFTPGAVHARPARPDNAVYVESGMMLALPSLGVSMDIVGVPAGAQSWDVTWLGQSAGCLEGSAFRTRVGNTVLTGCTYGTTSTNRARLPG